MQRNEKWRPLPNATSPSARLRAARTMPQWLQARGNALPPPPPPPPDDPPPMEPDYEVIEFPGQQTYSNTPIQRNLVDGKHKGDGKRCDLCGCSTPAVRCSQCNQQTFCMSCDEMYHRHPKRQAHLRKELVEGTVGNRQIQPHRPPLPPKGESALAPVPPPRRNKRFIAQRTAPLDQGEATSKVGFVGSLKRMMNTRPLPLVPFSQDRPNAIPHSSLEFQEHINPLHVSRENGMNEWQMFKGHRSGSFSALNGPGFSPMLQAHSMAQLNCPSCHHGVMWNEWGHGAPPMSPWGGMPPPGAWHSSAWLNHPMRRENGHGSSRRGSIRGRQRDSESSCSDEGDRMSTRGGRRRNVVSPALSRRSRPTMQSDYESEDEEEEEVRRTWRNPSKQSAHNVSPIDNRGMARRASLAEGINRPYRHQDDDTLSSHGGRRFSSTLTRRGHRDVLDDGTNHRMGRRNDFETISNHSGKRFEENIPRGRKTDYDDNHSTKGESFVEVFSSSRGSHRTSDLEDSVSVSGRRKSEVNGMRDRKENTDNGTSRRKNKRHERFTDTGRRRSSPVNHRYDNRGEPSSDSIEDNSVKEPHNKKDTSIGNEEILSGEIPGEDDQEEGELGPIPDTEWDCKHCTFVNEPGTRVCAVCCKTTMRPKIHKQEPPQKNQSKNYEKINLEQEVKKMNLEETPVKEPSKSPINKKRGTQEINEPNRILTSKGTSPPPQSISTQTYDVTGHKLKRTTSLADYDWKTPQRSHSRQSLLSDTQSLPVTPPKGRSPDRFSQSDVSSIPSAQPPPPQRKSSDSQLGLNTQRNVKRAGSQPPDYISTLVQKQVKQGLEMVKLLREAEEHQFSADDLAVALTHCGDEDPIIWLEQNWRNMIDTVVTLATNYGHERKENTVGTISASEARDALRLHDGNVWAAVTECVDQRQRKYAELLSRGNFSREDIITVLTAHHGNLEAAYTELNKSQLKPFLMRIWGPPQGSDNDSADFTKLAHDENGRMGRGGGKLFGEVSSYNSDINNDRIHKWLENQIYKPNISQSMMHLNLIGQLDSDDRMSVNLKPSKKRSAYNRRNSDVNRYLKSYYEANDHSLQITNKYTSMINLNKDLNTNEVNLAGKNRVIDALKISNFNTHRNNIEDTLSSRDDTNSNAGSNSSTGRKYYTEQQGINMNDYENVQVIDGSNSSKGGSKEESASNKETNSSSSRHSSEDISNEEFLNQINALRQTYKLEGSEDIDHEDNDIKSDVSSSESYESLASGEREKDNEQNETDEETTFTNEHLSTNENFNNQQEFVKNSLEKSPISEEKDVKSHCDEETTFANEKLNDQQIKHSLEKSSNSEEKDVKNIIQKSVMRKQELESNHVQNETIRNVNKTKTIEPEEEDDVTEFVIKMPHRRTSNEIPIVQEIKPTQPNGYIVQINKINVSKVTANEVTENILQGNIIPETQKDQKVVDFQEGIAILNGKERESFHDFKEENQEIVPKDSQTKVIRILEDSERNINFIKAKEKENENNRKNTEENLDDKASTNDDQLNTTEEINNELINIVKSEEIPKAVTNESNIKPADANDSNLIIQFQEIDEEQQDESIIQIKEPDLPTDLSKYDVHKKLEINAETPSQNKSKGIEKVVDRNTAKSNKPLPNENIKPEITSTVYNGRNDTEDTDSEMNQIINMSSSQSIENSEEKSIKQSQMKDDKFEEPNQFGGEELNGKETGVNEVLEATFSMTDDRHHELYILGAAELPENSSLNSPVTVIHKKTINEDKSQPLTYASDGYSDKDISSLPTDSEKDISSISEDIVINNKPSREMTEDKNPPLKQVLEVKDNVKSHFLPENTLDSNSNQLLNLLKESLTKEDVVERIVSTLFQTVLRASVDLQNLNETEQKVHSKKNKESETSSNFALSESEETSDSVFYEAEDSDNNEEQKNVTNEEEKLNRSIQIKRNRRTGRNKQNTEEIKEGLSAKHKTNIESTEKRDNKKEILLGDKEEREREIRRILAEGLVEAYDQAELAVQLMEMKFDEEQSVIAAKECTSLQAAVIFLQQECYLCAGKYSLKQMVSMLECDHRCCIDCANNYFTLQITERSINDCVCPFCKEPDLSRLEEDQALEYFSNLDIFLKAIVKEKVHELFQRKLRDRTLMQDPNFKWCVKCSSGFIANPRQKRSICPDCKTITCAKCGQPWEKEHEKMSCEEFAAWKEFNDPENQLARHLAENGVTCPKCNNRYVLAKGGCMHLTCPQCKHEFCSGCAKQFLMGSKCKVSDYCEKLGLHSHHPRNCLFYLRDKEPATLRKLLDDNAIDYKRKEENVSTRCRIQLLRETADGLVEAICGYPIEGEGLCRTHYIEHLVNVIRNNKLDPAPAMDLPEAQQELRRHGKTLPTRADGTSDRAYLDSCVKMILEEIPLE